MKHSVLSGFAIIILAFQLSCTNRPTGNPYALFDDFQYSGKDPIFETFKPDSGSFQNPILPGFYPDPSICRVDGDYYLVNSSFSYFPGIPIFHSRDLVHWNQLGHVLSRPSQLNLDSLQLSQGVFAPAIAYNKGTFYVINTLVNGGGNFYVTAAKPDGPWSDPVWLPGIDGIDPSFFFDTDGKAYIVNNGPPEGEALYDGHRAIWIQEFSVDSGIPVGPRKVIVNAGVDISKKPIWIEGPHIFRHNNFYYLIAAEGGTSTGHSEVVFRSSSVWGPYKPSSANPILTQRHLDETRTFPVSSTGHADFVQTPEGEWWAVFLGCRPYEDDLYNTGRETFMLPVSWKNEWPFIIDLPVPYTVKNPSLPLNKDNAETLSGNFKWTDSFSEPELNQKWNFIRTPRSQWYSLSSHPGKLKIDLQPVKIDEIKNPSFIGRRQQHASFESVVTLQPEQFDSSSSAGIIAFQNENHYIYLGVKETQRDYTIFLIRKGSDENSGKQLTLATLSAKKKTDQIFLKIEGKGSRYDFYYSLDGNEWSLIKGDVDARNLSTNKAGGFVGTYIGIYGTTGS